ncbi:MAG: SusC/RagA family TonB-linked outer membrane protein [Marinifilaceae bacterium]
MKKKRDDCFKNASCFHFLTKKALLWVLVLCVFPLSAFSEIVDQISIRKNNATLEEVIWELKKNTHFTFMYSDDDIANIKGINLNEQNAPIDAILSKCLKGTNLEYLKSKEAVIIRRTQFQPQQQEQVTKLIEITGTVKDNAGSLLPGATILIKGTSLGAVTDMNGSFKLNVPAKDAILVCSFIGMKNMEMTVGNKTSIHFILDDDQAEMEEVVVTGIYQRKKESFTGSSNTYSSKELKEIGNSNILQSLKTLDPSFAIIENNLYGSDPNRLPDVNVRGKTSVIGITSEYGTDPNQPLFILDGFESTLAIISDLSMDRVQNITVLKDAAATAIYGSKAANGVIVVETKAPVMGRLRLNYSGNFGFTFADLSDYNLMNSEEKLEFEKLAGFYGRLDDNGNIYDELSQTTYFSRLAEVRRGVDTYWMNEPLRFATSHRHNLFIEGGDAKVRYGLGINYGNTAGVMKGSDREILNGNFQLTYRTAKFSFSNATNIDYTKQNHEKVAFSDFSRSNPYVRKHDKDGEVVQVIEKYAGYNIYNPLYESSLNTFKKSDNFNFRNNTSIEWSVLTDLKARGRFSITKGTTKGEDFKSPKANTFYELKDEEKGTYSETHTNILSYDADASLTYGKTFRDVHMLNAVAGLRMQSSNTRMSGFTARGYTDERFTNPAFSQGYPEGGKPSYSDTEKRSMDYYFNAGYSYNNRYLADVSFRRDGTSLFGTTERFKTTWAFGLGWNIHNETFIKQNASWIDMLKLRYSMGNPGNQNFDAYIAMNIYNFTSSYPNPFGIAALVNTWGNNNLEWQRTIDQNFGIDIGFADNRVKVSFDYFIKDTDPLLVYLALPPSLGATQTAVNMGKQITKGYTASLNLYPIKKHELTWGINANARHLNYEYKKLGKQLEKLNQQSRGASLSRYYDGGSQSDLWAVRSAGIDPISGREIFIRKDGTHTFTHNVEDEVVVGNSQPKVEGVVGTNLYYKGFSASFNLRYRLGGQIFLNTLYNKVENVGSANVRYNQDKRALHDRWKNPGDIAKYKGISLTESTPISSRFVTDENTLSGESISLGYETRAKWLSRVGMSSAKISGFMNDIFRISTVKDERGIEYPFARSISFSLDLRF